MSAHRSMAGAQDAPAQPWLGAELKALTGLTVPIAAANLAEMAMAVTNMVMMGRLGATALAAGGLGGNLLWAVTVVPLGVVMAVGAVAAHASGAGEREGVGRARGSSSRPRSARPPSRSCGGWAPSCRRSGRTRRWPRC